MKGIYNATVDAPDLGDIMRIPPTMMRYGSELSQRIFLPQGILENRLESREPLPDIWATRDDVTTADVAEAAVFRTHELLRTGFVIIGEML